jgi:hypothetical protein
MVGNDVVDLLDPDVDPSTLHLGFDGRVFCRDELESLEASLNQVCERWRLWAAKEAAYKLVRKLWPRAVFSPSRFVVALAADAGGDRDTATGSVCHSGDRCHVSVVRSRGAIHAIATPDVPGGSQIVHGVRRLEPHELDPRDPEALGRAARRLCCETLAPRLGAAVEHLEVLRRGRIPELWLRGVRLGLDLSLSHHGSLVAFACALAPGAGAAPSRLLQRVPGLG